MFLLYLEIVGLKRRSFTKIEKYQDLARESKEVFGTLRIGYTVIQVVIRGIGDKV